MNNNKKIAKEMIKTAMIDGKLIAAEPVFQKNPIGHIVWFIVKKRKKNEALRKLFVLKECYKGPKAVSYSYRGLDLHKEIGKFPQETVILVLEKMIEKFCS